MLTKVTFNKDAGLGLIQISVNLSDRQFNQPNLCQSIIDTLIEIHINRSYLEMGFTKNILIKSKGGETKEELMLIQEHE